MSELVLEKLTQKVSNMLNEIAEVNVLVRQLPPAQESLNRIFERVDASHGALKMLEKGISLDQGRPEQPEAQTKSLGERLLPLRDAAERLSKSLVSQQAESDKSNREIIRIGLKIEETSWAVLALQNELTGRWDKNAAQLTAVANRLSDLRRAQKVITVVLAAGILLLALLHVW